MRSAVGALVLLVTVDGLSADNSAVDLVAEVTTADRKLTVKVYSRTERPVAIILQPEPYYAAIRYLPSKRGEPKNLKYGHEMLPMQYGWNGYLFLPAHKRKTIGPPKSLTLTFTLPENVSELHKLDLFLNVCAYRQNEEISEVLKATRFTKVKIEWTEGNTPSEQSEQGGGAKGE